MAARRPGAPRRGAARAHRGDAAVRRRQTVRALRPAALLPSALYAVACWLIVCRRWAARALWVVLAVAAVARAIALFAPDTLSDDIYRYIWDGRVQAAGINPYRYVPADPALAFLRDNEIYPHINRADYA